MSYNAIQLAVGVAQEARRNFMQQQHEQLEAGFKAWAVRHDLTKSIVDEIITKSNNITSDWWYVIDLKFKQLPDDESLKQLTGFRGHLGPNGGRWDEAEKFIQSTMFKGVSSFMHECRVWETKSNVGEFSWRVRVMF
jgi:hypothetical protein